MSTEERNWTIGSPQQRRSLRAALFALLAGLQPRTRFFIVLLPRILTRRCTPRRMAGHAAELTRGGNSRLAAWCWDKAIRDAENEQVCDDLLDLCIDVGQPGTAVKLAETYYDRNGMLLSAAVRLTGMLVLDTAWSAALQVFDRLLLQCQNEIMGRWPAPAWSDPPREHALRSSLTKLNSAPDNSSAVATELTSCMAKLCFSFGVFDASADLFRRSDYASLGAEEKIAFAYSLLRSGRSGEIATASEPLAFSGDDAPVDPDWQILLATVMFAEGADDQALSYVERAMRTRFNGHPEAEQILSDSRQILASLAACPHALAFDSKPDVEPTPNNSEARRKLFVCGNGWSGSGALYDALTDYEGFAEAPDTPIDRYVNACTGNEMMLIQGAAGLGRIWRQTRKDLALSKLELWELFRCHVLGGGGIGFTEHKSGKTALDLVGRLGSRYTGIFRQLFQFIATMPERAPLGQLRSALADTTEAFSAALTPDREGEWIVFNNALFGSNVDMLEIVSNFRAAIVTRDPLDQFADRRHHDLKHWMRAKRFVSVYRDSREAFRSRRKLLRPEQLNNVWEIEFERFVLDSQYRQKIIDWLLEGRMTRRVRHHFDPEISSGNIGIHEGLISREERLLIDAQLKEWRRI